MKMSELKILICDDSVFARKNFKNSVMKMGINTIFEAADGQQAIDLYKEQKPDLVFMDIVMPKVTGISAVKQILEFDKNAKIVMASSVGTQNYLKDAINAGAYEFLQKPIDPAMVLKIINTIAKED